TPDFVHDHDALGGPVIGGEHGGGVAVERGMTRGGDVLDVVRMMVDAADDDDVFEPARDEEFAVLQKAQVTRAQVTAIFVSGCIIADTCAEGGVVFAVSPVALRDARPSQPDFAYASVGQCATGVGVNDREMLVGQAAAASHQSLVLLAVIGAMCGRITNG